MGITTYRLALVIGCLASACSSEDAPTRNAGLVNDPERAAYALSLLGPSGQAVLLDALDSDHATVRHRAIRVLDTVELAARKDEAWLLAAIGPADGKTRTNLLHALAAKPPSEKAVPDLIRWVREERTHWVAVEALIAAGPAARNHTREIIGLFIKERAEYHRTGLLPRLLAAIGGPASVRALEQLLVTRPSGVKPPQVLLALSATAPESDAFLAQAREWMKDRASPTAAICLALAGHDVKAATSQLMADSRYAWYLYDHLPTELGAGDKLVAKGLTPEANAFEFGQLLRMLVPSEKTAVERRLIEELQTSLRKRKLKYAELRVAALAGLNAPADEQTRLDWDDQTVELPPSDPIVFETIVGVLGSEEGSLARAAAAAIRRLEGESERLAPALAKALRSGDSELEQEALFAVEEHGVDDAEVLNAVRQLMQQGAGIEKRKHCLAVLGRLGRSTKKSSRWIARWLEDPRLREAATIALIDLGCLTPNPPLEHALRTGESLILSEYLRLAWQSNDEPLGPVAELDQWQEQAWSAWLRRLTDALVPIVVAAMERPRSATETDPWNAGEAYGFYMSKHSESAIRLLRKVPDLPASVARLVRAHPVPDLIAEIRYSSVMKLYRDPWANARAALHAIGEHGTGASPHAARLLEHFVTREWRAPHMTPQFRKTWRQIDPDDKIAKRLVAGLRTPVFSK